MQVKSDFCSGFLHAYSQEIKDQLNEIMQPITYDIPSAKQGRGGGLTPSALPQLTPTSGKPAYNSPEYWQAVKSGQITWEEARQDDSAYNVRRQRSLQTCHRYNMAEMPRYKKPTTRAYTPETSAIVDEDRNLNANADKAARFLMRQAYQKARDTRTIRITVSYIAAALGRSVRTVQRYLRSLADEGYIRIDIVRSSVTGMVACLEITLLAPLFPDHHKKHWPQARRIPDTTFLSDKQSQIKYSKKEPRNSWAIRCMNGVHRAYMKTKPLLDTPLLET